MFEELFEGPIARARQRESPLPDERRHFLSHLQALGYARSSLRAVACELIVIAARLDLAGADLLNATVVEAAARRWATHQMRRAITVRMTIGPNGLAVERFQKTAE